MHKRFALQELRLQYNTVYIKEGGHFYSLTIQGRIHLSIRMVTEIGKPQCQRYIMYYGMKFMRVERAHQLLVMYASIIDAAG